ncbi:DinB family protein [Spirosoma pomorum]
MHKLETARQMQTRIDRVLDTITREFRSLPEEQLRYKPAPDRWSILECLQHLNLAERFYIRNLQHKVDRLGVIQTSPSDQALVAGWVGKAMLYMVDPQTKIKLPAPGILRPRRASELDPTDVLNQFVELQTLLRDLLNKAVYLDWNQESMSTLFGNWLTIRLGDAMLMLVAHTERHINQAIRVKSEMSTFTA